MKIVYTKHASGKFKSLNKLNWHFTKKSIGEVLENPNYSSEEKERGVFIASKIIDNKHYLRVIYTLRSGIITIVTFYPTKKGKYENP